MITVPSRRMKIRRAWLFFFGSFSFYPKGKGMFLAFDLSIYCVNPPPTDGNPSAMAFLFRFLFLFTRKEKGTTPRPPSSPLVVPPSVVAFLFHFEKRLAFSVGLCYNDGIRTIHGKFP